MKISVVTLFIHSCVLLAGWSSDPGINLQVSAGADTAFCPMISTGTAGDTYIAWVQQKNGVLDMRMQRFDLLGNPLWGSDGILVCGNFTSGEVYLNNLITDVSGAAVLTLCVESRSSVDLYTYRISAEGNMLWGSDGILLSDTTLNTVAWFPSAAATPSGDVVISWSMVLLSDTAWTVMQRIAPDGSLFWGEGVTVGGDSTGQSCWEATMCPTGTDDVILTYMLSDSDGWHKRIYAMKWDDTGSPVWSSPAVISDSKDILQQCIQPPTYTDGSGGFYIAWQEYDSSGDVTSLVQHVTSSGFPAMNIGGVPVSTMPSRNNSEPYLAVSESFNDVFIFWREEDHLQTQNGLYGQKMDSGGSRLWTDNGISFIDLQNDGVGNISVQTCGDSSAVFYIEETGSNNDIAWCMFVDSAGDYIWGSHMIEVSDATCDRNYYYSSSLCWDQQWVVVWSDDRNSTDMVYAQNVKLDGTLGTSGLGTGEATAPVPGIHIVSVVPNPASSITTVTFTLENSSFVTLGLFDTSGRAVSLIADGFYQAGNHTAVLDINDFPAGVYLIRLDALGHSITKRYVVLN